MEKWKLQNRTDRRMEGTFWKLNKASLPLLEVRGELQQQNMNQKKVMLAQCQSQLLDHLLLPFSIHILSAFSQKCGSIEGNMPLILYSTSYPCSTCQQQHANMSNSIFIPFPEERQSPSTQNPLGCQRGLGRGDEVNTFQFSLDSLKFHFFFRNMYSATLLAFPPEI